MPLFTCTFTNKTHLTVRMGLFGKDHEYRTDALGPQNSETTDQNSLIVGSDRVAVAFDDGSGEVLAQKETIIQQKTGVILIASTNGGFAINFVGLP